MNFFSEIFIFYSMSIGVFTFRSSFDSTCRSTNGENCVDIYECSFFDGLLAKTGVPRPHHVIKEIRKRQCGFVGKNPAVCCPQTENVIESDNRENEINTGQSVSQHKNINLLPMEKCGALSLDSRITHGTEAVLGEFPWMALIVYETNSGPDFLCAGSLISERYILTAAHCILKTIIGVRLGEYNILTTKDCDETNFYCAPAVQDFYIESAEIHSKYNRATDHNDIALIRLAQVADLTQENVSPICLPFWNVVVQEEGKLLTVAGWGMTEAGHKNAILKKASVPTVPLEKCQKIFEGQANITAFQICAGGKGGDSCNGDSGGPLSTIIPVKEVPKHVQYGIVSYGPKRCGTYGMPGIYTRIDPYLEWILNTIRP